MKKQKNKKPANTTNEPLAHDLQERIRQRAQEIHQARGATPGHDLENWLQAEREIKAAMRETSDPQT
jgi:hypothetical protein